MVTPFKGGGTGKKKAKNIPNWVRGGFQRDGGKGGSPKRKKKKPSNKRGGVKFYKKKKTKRKGKKKLEGNHPTKN